MRALLKNLVGKSPLLILELGQLVYDLMPPAIRYGRPYTEALELLRQSEYWDVTQLRDYQDDRIKKLIRHSYDNVPYYNEIMKGLRLTPRDVETVDDLPKLPLLTKDIVRKRQKDLVAKNISYRDLHAVHTSGSTGTALDFYMDRYTRPMDRALVFRHLSSLGYRPGDSSAFFKGLPLADPNKVYRYFPGSNEMQFTFHMVNQQRLSIILDELEKFQPTIIDAWPSCLYILARYMRRTDRSFASPKFIHTSSETHYPHVKHFIEETFNAPVIDWYGQEETVAVAVQCGLAEGYHIQMEMAAIEMIPYKQEVNEIVGTCLHNFAQPFIRYKTGDLGIIGKENCPCGRKHPLIDKIIGRKDDFIVTSENAVISPLIIHLAFFNLTQIKEAQIIQEDIDTLRVLVTSWNGISESTKEHLRKELMERIESPTMNLVIEEVKEIPQKAGALKRAFIISRVEGGRFSEAAQFND